MARWMISIHDLQDMAHLLGVTLTHHNEGKKGWYSPSLRTISTRRGMAVWDYKSTLAHEIGHAMYRDERTSHGHFDQRQETRADRFAAKLLISEVDLLHLAPWHGNDLHSLALDLEVTPKLLRTYLQQHPDLLKEDAA